MSQVIVYLQDNGGVAVIHPTPEALSRYGIEAIALKDVPKGKRFGIIDAADLPNGRTERDAWSIADRYLTDGVGGSHSEFQEDKE